MAAETVGPGARARPAAEPEAAGPGRQDLLQRVVLGMVVAGGVLLPLGIAVIVLGWYGAAHTPYAFEQNSYLISGGLLGLGLVLVGGFVYFGAWLARLAAAQRADTDRVVAALERLAAGAPPAAAVAPLVATPTGTMVHRRDCPVVANRSDLRPVSPADPGLRPCRICDPLGGPDPRRPA